jgi:hypothetical protein
MEDHTAAEWTPIVRVLKELPFFLSCMRTPLADAACAKDYETVLLLTEHGARLGDFAERVDFAERYLAEKTVRYRINDKELIYTYNPFVPAIHAKDYALLETLLTEIDRGSGALGRWLDQSMTAALRIANPPDCDFDMAVTLAGRIVGTETSLPHDPSREIIDSIMMLQIEEAVLGIEGYNIFAAVVLDHELLYSSMMNNGVDIHIRSRDGLTNLHFAVDNENIFFCKHLIRDGMDIGTRDMWGMSPLLESVYYGHAEALKLLLANSTSPVDPDRLASPMQRGSFLGEYSTKDKRFWLE